METGVETGPVFADPSGRRRRILRLIGFGTMAVMAAFLVAVAVAVSGGPQAPLTQWAVPRAPAAPGAKQNAQQAGNRPFDHATSTSSPGNTGNAGGTAPGGTAPGATASATPSATASVKASGKAGSPSATPSSSATATVDVNGHGNTTGPGKGKGGNPHSSPTPTPTA